MRHAMLSTAAVLALALALPLGGCAITDPIDEDTTAGRTKVVAEFWDPAEIPIEVAVNGPSPRSVEWTTNQDKDTVAVRYDAATGGFVYEAGGVRATEPSQVEANMRAALGDALTDQIKAALPDGVNLSDLARIFVGGG